MENREWLWGYREVDGLGGHDPYSNSKACAEMVTQSYRDSFFPVNSYATHQVALATARAGNVIGGGDWTTDQLIPDVIRAFQVGQPVVLRQPDSVRPWQHVLDCLAGYLTLAERLASDGKRHSGPWNFGPAFRDARRVGWMVESLANKWGGEASWVTDTGIQPHEAGMLRLDHSKAVSKLGWEPRVPLREALDWTVEWYREFFSEQSAWELCLRQIGRWPPTKQSPSAPPCTQGS